MKSKKSVVSSADSALDAARKKCDELTSRLENIHFGSTVQDEMPKVRAILAELTQRIHEFNAYNNVTETK